MANNILPVSHEGAVRAMVRDKFPNGDIQRTTYRYTHKLTANNATRNFDLVNGNGTRQPGERYINSNDTVVLFALKVGIAKVDDALHGNINNAITYTYPDPLIFSEVGTPPEQPEAAALMAVYNGDLQLKIDTDILLESYKLYRHYQAPVTQKNSVEVPSYNTETSGYVDLVHPQILPGDRTLELIFAPGSGADLTHIGGKSGTSNFLVIEFDAYVVKGGASRVTVLNQHNHQNTRN